MESEGECPTDSASKESEGGVAIKDGGGGPVKRPMNSFLIFCKKHRALVHEKHPNMDNRSVTKLLGDLWKNLGPEERVAYEDLSKQNKDAFYKANPNFKWRQKESGLAPPLSPLSGNEKTAHEKSAGRIARSDSDVVEAEDVQGQSVQNQQVHGQSVPCQLVQGQPFQGHIQLGKLADPASMGGLNLLLYAGQQSLLHSPSKSNAPQIRESSNLANLELLASGGSEADVKDEAKPELREVEGKAERLIKVSEVGSDGQLKMATTAEMGKLQQLGEIGQQMFKKQQSADSQNLQQLQQLQEKHMLNVQQQQLIEQQQQFNVNTQQQQLQQQLHMRVAEQLQLRQHQLLAHQQLLAKLQQQLPVLSEQNKNNGMDNSTVAEQAQDLTVKKKRRTKKTSPKADQVSKSTASLKQPTNQMPSSMLTSGTVMSRQPLLLSQAMLANHSAASECDVSAALQSGRIKLIQTTGMQQKQIEASMQKKQLETAFQQKQLEAVNPQKQQLETAFQQKQLLEAAIQQQFLLQQLQPQNMAALQQHWLNMQQQNSPQNQFQQLQLLEQLQKSVNQQLIPQLPLQYLTASQLLQIKPGQLLTSDNNIAAGQTANFSASSSISAASVPENGFSTSSLAFSSAANLLANSVANIAGGLSASSSKSGSAASLSANSSSSSLAGVKQLLAAASNVDHLLPNSLKITSGSSSASYAPATVNQITLTSMAPHKEALSSIQASVRFSEKEHVLLKSSLTNSVTTPKLSELRISSILHDGGSSKIRSSLAEESKISCRVSGDGRPVLPSLSTRLEVSRAGGSRPLIGEPQYDHRSGIMSPAVTSGVPATCSLSQRLLNSALKTSAKMPSSDGLLMIAGKDGTQKEVEEENLMKAMQEGVSINRLMFEKVIEAVYSNELSEETKNKNKKQERSNPAENFPRTKKQMAIDRTPGKSSSISGDSTQSTSIADMQSIQYDAINQSPIPTFVVDKNLSDGEPKRQSTGLMTFGEIHEQLILKVVEEENSGNPLKEEEKNLVKPAFYNLGKTGVPIFAAEQYSQKSVEMAALQQGRQLNIGGSFGSNFDQKLLRETPGHSKMTLSQLANISQSMLENSTPALQKSEDISEISAKSVNKASKKHLLHPFVSSSSSIVQNYANPSHIQPTSSNALNCTGLLNTGESQQNSVSRLIEQFITRFSSNSPKPNVVDGLASKSNLVATALSEKIPAASLDEQITNLIVAGMKGSFEPMEEAPLLSRSWFPQSSASDVKLKEGGKLGGDKNTMRRRRKKNEEQELSDGPVKKQRRKRGTVSKDAVTDLKPELKPKIDREKLKFDKEGNHFRERNFVSDYIKEEFDRTYSNTSIYPEDTDLTACQAAANLLGLARNARASEAALSSIGSASSSHLISRSLECESNHPRTKASSKVCASPGWEVAGKASTSHDLKNEIKLEDGVQFSESFLPSIGSEEIVMQESVTKEEEINNNRNLCNREQSTAFKGSSGTMMLSSLGKISSEKSQGMGKKGLRKSKRSNRAKKYKELVSQGVLYSTKKRLDSGDPDTLDDTNDEDDSADDPVNLPAGNSVGKFPSRDRFLSQDDFHHRTEFQTAAHRYKSGDFDLEAKIASLPVCHIPTERRGGAGKIKLRSQSHTNNNSSNGSRCLQQLTADSSCGQQAAAVSERGSVTAAALAGDVARDRKKGVRALNMVDVWRLTKNLNKKSVEAESTANNGEDVTSKPVGCRKRKARNRPIMHLVTVDNSKLCCLVKFPSSDGIGSGAVSRKVNENGSNDSKVSSATSCYSSNSKSNSANGRCDRPKGKDIGSNYNTSIENSSEYSSKKNNSKIKCNKSNSKDSRNKCSTSLGIATVNKINNPKDIISSCNGSKYSNNVKSNNKTALTTAVESSLESAATRSTKIAHTKLPNQTKVVPCALPENERPPVLNNSKVTCEEILPTLDSIPSGEIPVLNSIPSGEIPPVLDSVSRGKISPVLKSIASGDIPPVLDNASIEEIPSVLDNASSEEIPPVLENVSTNDGENAPASDSVNASNISCGSLAALAASGSRVYHAACY